MAGNRAHFLEDLWRGISRKALQRKRVTTRNSADRFQMFKMLQLAGRCFRA
uniref:Uncharacterized protein n=1 Tax=Arundo donax TaxID=35708 RepID=A0A0A9GIR7_ARUDO